MVHLYVMKKIIYIFCAIAIIYVLVGVTMMFFIDDMSLITVDNIWGKLPVIFTWPLIFIIGGGH